VGDRLTLTLKTVVPWGRSLEEYVGMFALSLGDLDSRLLDCGGGPASFNAELAARGKRVVSCDPLYRFAAGQIAARVDETHPVMVAGMEAERERFVWTDAGSPARLGERRLAIMRRFLADYEAGPAQGRYVAAALPALPFGADEFDLALCSHLLFLYSAQLSTDFHLAAIREMLRVAGQARIFPLLDMGGRRSAHLQPVVDELAREGYQPRIERVLYEFQRGGDQLLRIERGGQPPSRRPVPDARGSRRVSS
jgi:SAM-dependent methyltransferase